ncbi:MAG TPA: zinc ribbon domain-containing protein [Terriglobales bacterium]|nr:zinc ribbon domain-containing protein [Terriglobales bacterium]
MPLYEYECKKCHHRVERIVKFSDPPLKKCPKCGGPVEQLISAPAVQFKGSGWYVTDYAKKPGASASSNGDSSEKGESSSKDDSSSKDGSSKAETSSSKDDSSSKGKGKESKDSTAKAESKSEGPGKKKASSEKKP